MRRLGSDRRGFSLIEILVTTAIGALLSLAIIRFMTVSLRGSGRAEGLSQAQHTLDDMMKSVRTNFQRRYWEFPAVQFPGYPIPGITLTTSTAFNTKTGGPGSFKCGALAPSCQNMAIMQTVVHRNPPAADTYTYRKVAFETTCQDAGKAPKFPPGFDPNQYQSDGGSCTVPPVVTLAVDDPAASKETQTFLGGEIIGSALCFRECILSTNDNPTKLPVVEYQIEAAVIYRASNKWNVLKGTTTLSTGNVMEGVEVLPPQ